MSNQATVQTIYAAFGRGDVPAILEHLGEDCLWEYQPITHDIPYLQARRGRAGAAEFFQIIGPEFEVTKFTVNNILENGNVVVALIDIDVTLRRNGKSFREVDEVHIWHFDERGKVAKFRHCVDTYAQHRAWHG